jgi:hypothetical protein
VFSAVSVYDKSGTVVKADGSTVQTTIATDGTKSEVRTFPAGEVTRVTRTTRPTGTREVVVEYRDGRKNEIKDESDIERAMDATGDAIVAAADKTWEVSRDVGKEIGDKAEDVGSEVGDKAEDVADKTVDTSKKVGKEVGKGAKKAGKKIKDVID